jgi:hypothetical protein
MVEKTLEEQLAEVLAENQALRAKQPKAPGVTLKVGKSGGVSVYGLGRFPVTLYASQMERLLDHGTKIREFIAANAATLAKKV